MIETICKTGGCFPIALYDYIYIYMYTKKIVVELRGSIPQLLRLVGTCALQVSFYSLLTFEGKGRE